MFFSYLENKNLSFYRVLLVSLISFFVLTSCNLKIGEKPPESKMAGFKSDACLSISADNLGAFFKGEATDHDIAYSWDCFASIVKSFKEKVRCKEKDQCTPTEISIFIEDNFVDENINAQVKQKFLSDGLQKQLMKLKKLFLGGNEEYITSSELDGLIERMGQIKVISTELNPSMKMLTLRWQTQMMSMDLSLKDFDTMNMGFVKSMQNFSALIHKENSAYSFDDFYQFLKELEGFSKSNWTWVSKVEQFLPLFKKLKKAIAGGDESVVRNNEWDLFILLGSRGYAQYLRYYYFIKDLGPEFDSVKLAYLARTTEDILMIFYDLLNLKDSHQIAKNEIKDLFDRFSELWKEFKTSDEFLNQFMKFKQILLGGTDQGIEKDDFLRAKKKVNSFKQIVELFLPYYEVYGFSWKSDLLTVQEKEDYFAKATASLSQIAIKLTDEFQLESGYSYKDLLLFAQELEKFYSQPEDKLLSPKIAQYSCLIQNSVDILADKKSYVDSKSCPKLVLNKTELSLLLKNAVLIFNQYLRYHYFLQDKNVSFFDNRYFKNVNTFVSESLEAMALVIKGRKDKHIPKQTIVNTLVEAQQAKIIPNTVQLATLKNLLNVVLDKVLIDPKARISKQIPLGLDYSHIYQLRSEFYNWFNTEQFINSQFELKLNPDYFNYNNINKIFKEQIASSTDVYFQYGMTEFLKHFQSYFPLGHIANRKLVFNKNPNPIYNYKSLSQHNLNRYISRILIRSYSQSIENINKYVGVTSCEANAAFNDLKQILVELDILNKNTSESFIDSRFIEANIFLPHSDGNVFLSFEELADLSNFIFSGFAVNDVSEKLVRDNCKLTAEKTASFVDWTCLRDTYRNNYKTIFATMPKYIKYIETEPISEWQSAFFNNLKATGLVQRADMKVDLSDALLLPHIIQYGESIMLKFDLNYDGVIDKAEGIKAYPSFAALLKRVAKPQIDNGDISEGDLEALFTFILKYGKIPSCDKSFVLLCLFEKNIREWLDWKSNYKKPEYQLQANRSQVAKVLGLIADMVSNQPSSNTPDNSCSK